MYLLRDFDTCPQALQGAVVAIGNFDGLHPGHRRVLSEARDRAARTGAPAPSTAPPGRSSTIWFSE